MSAVANEPDAGEAPERPRGRIPAEHGESRMLDVVFGSGEHGELAQSLHRSIQDLNLSGTLYFSHPDFGAAGADGPARADALLVSEKCGLVAFDLSASPQGRKRKDEWISNLESRQKDMYWSISAMLIADKDLLQEREFAIVPEIVTIVEKPPKGRSIDDFAIIGIERIESALEQTRPLEQEQVRALNSIFQGISGTVSALNGARTQPEAYCGAIFGDVDGKSAVLDRNQLQAALSCPNGPQRIRGVSGSGKTTTLALKAAQLHVANPDWRIAVTFRNMALEFHYHWLVRRFMAGMNRGEPDWSKLHVVRAWDGERGSFYDRVAGGHGIDRISRSDAKSRNQHDMFDGVFMDGVERLTGGQSSEPMYDAILIDDAQELPPSFFQFAHAAARAPKRIVWASDYFQSLMGYDSCRPERLFGDDEDGRTRVSLTERNGQPPQDITLGISYRSTPRTLTVAHALACGIHRQTANDEEEPIFRMHEDPKTWKGIGYRDLEGNLGHGESVTLERDPKGDSIRFGRSAERRLHISNVVRFKSFETSEAQWRWISEGIDGDIRKTGLSPEDILIVFGDPDTAKEEQFDISRALEAKGILSNIVRAPTSRDQVVKKGCVTIANVFSARETEFPMVYFASAQKCHGDPGLLEKRNALFTGMTRSTAWVRVCGVGEAGRMLEEEFNCVKENGYRLKFDYPAVGRIREMKKRRRESVTHAKTKADRKIGELLDVVEMIRIGKMSVDALPKDLVREVRATLTGSA